MKIIDRDGRLFGLLNIIDLFIIVVIVGKLGYGGYKILKVNPQLTIQTKPAVIELEISPVRQLSVDAVNEGEKVFDSDTGAFLGIIKEKKVEKAKENVRTSDGKIVLSEFPDQYRHSLVIEAQIVETTDSIALGNLPVQVGKSLAIKTKKLNSRGVIITINN